MKGGDGCLTCRYCVFHTPSDWTPVYEGHTFGGRDAARVIRETGYHISAICAFMPEWREVETSHWCGQHKMRSGFRHSETVSEAIHGSWLKQERDSQKLTIARLQRELKVARDLSANRLKRLKGKPPRRKGIAPPHPDTQEPAP